MTISTWSGTVTDIGPLYPFVGSEMLMVAIVAAAWIAWHVAQIRAESREFKEDEARLRQQSQMNRALDREG
jgi:hypothetical protein